MKIINKILTNLVFISFVNDAFGSDSIHSYMVKNNGPFKDSYVKSFVNFMSDEVDYLKNIVERMKVKLQEVSVDISTYADKDLWDMFDQVRNEQKHSSVYGLKIEQIEDIVDKAVEKEKNRIKGLVDEKTAVVLVEPSPVASSSSLAENGPQSFQDKLIELQGIDIQGISQENIRKRDFAEKQKLAGEQEQVAASAPVSAPNQIKEEVDTSKKMSVREKAALLNDFGIVSKLGTNYYDAKKRRAFMKD